VTAAFDGNFHGSLDGAGSGETALLEGEILVEWQGLCKQTQSNWHPQQTQENDLRL
jgi:hypothetical protein